MAETSQTGRRQEYAIATRAAIIRAARELFAQQGFFTTRVQDIAQRARVAPATVYTSVGGKHAILAELAEQLADWQPRESTFDAIARARTSRDVLVALADGTSATHEDWSDVQRIVSETAPHDAKIADVQRRRLALYRRALETVVERLAALEGPAWDRDRALTTLWFYFGPFAYQPLHDGLGWTYADARTWLLAQCERALELG